MMLVYTKDGNTYSCSGTLLADRARSYKPYVYTANHCIDSQATASTVLTLWKGQYPNCSSNNSGAPSGTIWLRNGAQLLDTSVYNDHSLILLNDSAPAGAWFSGSDPNTLTYGDAVMSINHPNGDVKKISLGYVTAPSTTSIVGGVTHSSAVVDITQGANQPGSSGGGLFSCDTSGCYLRGGLQGGSNAQICTAHQSTSFSRFDAAYPTLKTWLGNAPSQPSISTTPAIAAGGFFSLGLKSDGTLWAWGKGYTPVPTIVSGVSGVTAVSAYSHVMALKSDGTVWVWGENTYGQLGDGTTSKSSMPKPFNGISGVNAVGAGSSFSVVLKSDGTVWSWGSNELGQFGNGTYDTPITSTPVQAMGIANAKEIAVGDYYAVALLKDGTVWGWGINQYGQLGVTTNDQCRQWSANWNCSKTPVKAGNLDKVIAIAAGSNHTLALKSDGTVWAWGLNTGGQLGDGTTTNSVTPKRVPLLTNIAAIAAGSNHSLALRSDGTVWTWGWNDLWQLGYATSDSCTGGGLFGSAVPCSKTPTRVPGISGISVIAGGSSHSLALKPDGAVWAWGMGKYYGQLGNNITVDSLVPVQAVGAGAQGFLNLGVNQAPSPIVTPPENQMECLFTWVETKYPELFAPSGVQTKMLGAYSYRFYSSTNAYIAVSSGDNHFYYLGILSGNSLMDIGSAATWYTTAGCK